MATFLELYGTKLDRELGSVDRTERFTTALRKEYVNEGHRKFNERAGCYVKRAAITLVSDTQEYDLESAATFAAEDYLRPAKVTASLRKYDGSGSANTDYSYLEGDSQLPYISEEELNQRYPGWRSIASGTPEKWFFREDGGSVYVGLYPAPDVTSGETWALLLPYVAKAPTLTLDADVPYLGRISLEPYHEAILYYAAAQCELLRKDREAHVWQMSRYSALIAQYTGDKSQPRGSSVRLAQNYFPMRGGRRAVNPLTWP